MTAQFRFPKSQALQEGNKPRKGLYEKETHAHKYLITNILYKK